MMEGDERISIMKTDVVEGGKRNIVVKPRTHRIIEERKTIGEGRQRIIVVKPLHQRSIDLRKAIMNARKANMKDRKAIMKARKRIHVERQRARIIEGRKRISVDLRDEPCEASLRDLERDANETLHVTRKGEAIIDVREGFWKGNWKETSRVGDLVRIIVVGDVREDLGNRPGGQARWGKANHHHRDDHPRR